MAPDSSLELMSPPGRGRRARRASTRGVTLMDVLISATLLSLVVLGSLGALTRGLTLIHHARMITLSSQVLQSAVEDLRLQNYSVISAYAAQSQPVELSGEISGELFTSSFTTTSAMTLEARFTTVAASTASQLGLTGVEVTVTWREGPATYIRSARTNFGEKGMSDYIYVGF